MDIEKFKKNGYIVVRNFYDIEKEILPLQRDIRKIIQLVARAHDVKYEDTGLWHDGYLSIT